MTHWKEFIRLFGGSPTSSELADDQGERNIRAGLDTIAACEGTAYPNGYRYLFGSRPDRELLFSSYEDHPRIRTYETRDEFIHNGRLDYTTAAGRYQIIEPTWDEFCAAQGLRAFDPAGQDACAIWLLQMAGAYGPLRDGNFIGFLAAACRTWASLPGATSGQPTRNLKFAERAFSQAGGVFA